MDDKVYEKLIKAKKTGNLGLMKTLYQENPDNTEIKFEYANLLLSKNRMEAGRSILLSLLNTPNSSYAILRLGKLEKELGNIERAKQYFRKLLNTSNESYAFFELGKIEKENGNTDLARKYFKNLLTSKNKNYSMLELGKIEKEEGNIKLARYYFEQLLTSPIKNCALSELGRLEYEDGNVDIARKYFEQLLDTKDKEYAISLLLLLEISEQNYEAAYDYILYAQKQDIKIRGKFLLYISKMLNVAINNNYNRYDFNYTIRQLLDYDEFCNIETLCKKQKKGDIRIADNVKLGNVLKNVKELLIPENKIKKLIFNDTYIISYKDLGLTGNDHLFVATIPNSKDIITIHTISDKNNIDKHIHEVENEKILRK